MIDYDKLKFEIPEGVKYPESYVEGKRTERRFLDYCENNGFIVRKAETYNDIYQHFDFYVKNKNGVEVRIDVKSEKKLNRWDAKTNKEIQWLELKGVKGHEGWLYGKAHYIAFKYGTVFIIAKTKDLLELTLKLRKLDSNGKPIICTSDDKKMYETLQRDDRKDEVVLVKTDDIKTLKYDVLKWVI